METQIVSEEQVLVQNYKGLRLELIKLYKKNHLIVRDNVIFSEKNISFLHRVNVIFGYYHSKCIHNRHSIIQKQFPRQ